MLRFQLVDMNSSVMLYLIEKM